MTNDPEGSQAEAAASLDPGAEAGAAVATAMERLTGFIGHLASVANAAACVGPAETANGHTVIPVASVSVQGRLRHGLWRRHRQ